MSEAAAGEWVGYDDKGERIVLKKGELVMVAPGDKPVLVATTAGGHTFGVSHKGTPVPKEFQKAALQAGCMPWVMREQLEDGITNTREPTRIEVIVKAIEGIMAEVDAEPTKATKFLTGDGRPDAQIIMQRIGGKVSAAERDQAFEIFKNGDDD